MATPIHYGLVQAGSDPLLVGQSPQDDSSSEEPRRSTRATSSPRDDLSQLYQTYAELYPNPRLIEEKRQANELVQAALAAQQQASSSSSTSKETRRPGFFARLLGGGGAVKEEDPPAGRGSTSDDIPLVYHSISEEQEAGVDESSLCGTQQRSLDPTCIPLEAISLARFHLTSQVTRGVHPNAVRWGPLLGRSVPTSLIVVGLGQIAELQPNQKSTILETSDRDTLQDYSKMHPKEFRVEYVRACGISPNCIAVSWGFLDGLIGVYRRIQFQNDPHCGWEQLWLIKPSSPVLDAIADIFDVQDDEAHPGSPLLRVADMVPLRVTTGDRGRPIVATLAIARVGGYLELLPLPTDLWFGPLLTPENHKRPRTPKRHAAGRNYHYSFGKYIGSPTIALTTAEHHVDIQSIACVRTSVGIDTEWNQEAFPNSPPAEYIVAVSGSSTQSPKEECISFWSVSTLFSDDAVPTAGSTTQPPANPLGFDIHASLLYTTLISAGPPVSIFCHDGIMQHWRRPRQVTLRPDAAIVREEDEAIPMEEEPVITTISTPAPVSGLQFLDGGALLAIVDWNGGTSLWDCAILKRTAAQSLSWGELAQLELADEMGSSQPLQVKELISRSKFASTIGNRNQVGVLQWLRLPGVTDNNNEGDNNSTCSLVVLLSNQKKLLVATWDWNNEYGEPLEEPEASILAIPFPGDGAIMGDLGSGNLLFVSKRHTTATSKLTLFVMQQLRPTAIVEGLAREGKYEQAIEAARNLDEFDQETLADVLQECHTRLWESKRDIDHLADTRNISYIVKQAVQICESLTGDDLAELSIDKIRLLCQLAIAMGRNHDASQESLKKLGSFLVRLGTYELLCKCFAAETNLASFCDSFRSALMVDLACSLADRGDIAALSVVMFRHRTELISAIFTILSRLPPFIDLEKFIHLIPVLKNDRVSDVFLPTTVDFAELHISQMPQHLESVLGVQVVLDNSDEKAVLERNISNGTGTLDAITKAHSARWFESRSIQMQDFSGDIHAVVQLCQVGLWCNGFDLGKSSTPGDELQQILKTWKSAKSLERLLLDDYVSFDSPSEESKESAMAVISTHDLLSMDLPDLMDFILAGQSEFSTLRARCNDYLQPLLLEFDRDHSENGNVRFDSSSIALYCSGLVANCLSMAMQDPHDARICGSAQRALNICAAIASSSKASLRQKDRLVKDNHVLTDLTLTTIKGIAPSLASCVIPFDTTREMVEVIWTMYEALPDQAPSSMVASDDFDPILKRLDALQKDLVCTDILSRWLGSKAFSFLAKRLGESADFDNTVGVAVISRLCRAFIVTLRAVKIKDSRSSSLQDLLSDIQRVNVSCCYGGLDLPKLLSQNLVVPLLESEYFTVVVTYCQSDPSLVNHDLVKDAILAYIDDAVFSEDENGNRVKAAMKCQDIVGPSFPDIQPGLQEMRRYLDAVHFTTTVIYDGRPNQPMIRPADLKKQLPLDVIETTIKDVPLSVICGCPQWQDDYYAVSANEMLRLADRKVSVDTEQEREMPVLPGGAIFHLATILGLEDENAALVVKSRVIHHALSIGLHGAAAAVCRTLVASDVPEFEDDAVALAKLGAVSEIVCDETYSDLATKDELCRAVLTKFSGCLEIANSHVFEKIVDVSTSLDNQRSRDSQRMHEPNSPLRITKLQHHIFTEYNADVHGLFADLMGQTKSGMVHDSLMNALSRFVIYWCVYDSKSLRHTIRKAEKTEARENLMLGCSLILHIPSRITLDDCVTELQEIAADQAATVSTEERFGSDGSYAPDPDIVNRMIRQGYNERAALRSVLMTQNAGYNEALQWAFAHSNDPDFNEPMFLLRDPRRCFIDEDAIQLLQKALYAVRSGEIVAIVKSHYQSIPSPTPTQLKPYAQKQKTHIVPTPPRTIRPVPPTNVKEQEHIDGKQSIVTAKSFNTSAPMNGTRPTRKVQPKPPTSLDTKIPVHAAGTQASNTTRPPSPASSKFPSLLASPRDASEERLALLKRGKEELSKRRANRETPDRSKLIANGRELLRKTRAEKLASNGTPTNTSTSFLARPQTRLKVPQKTTIRDTKLPPSPPPRPAPSRAASTTQQEVDDAASEASGWNFEESFDELESVKVPQKTTIRDTKLPPSPPPRPAPSRAASTTQQEVDDAASEASGWNFEESFDELESVKVPQKTTIRDAKQAPSPAPRAAPSNVASTSQQEADDAASEASGWDFEDNFDELE